MRHCLGSKSPFVSPKGWTAHLFGYYGEISVFVKPDPLSTAKAPSDKTNSTNGNFEAYLQGELPSPLPFGPAGRAGNVKQARIRL